jgi:hypothetical protein
MNRSISALWCTLAALCAPGPSVAQENIPAKHEIAFNRYYTYEELLGHMRKIAEAYPDIVKLESIGKSGEGRELVVAIVNSTKTGPDTSKPGFWIDGNVHGNEIQSAEVVLYTLWYLAKSYGHNQDLTEILDNASFYLVVSQNPDGREGWFREAHTSSSSRHNRRKVDNDRDGLLDEDAPEDLNGDGMITQMWIADPNGRFIRDRNDDRVFVRVAADQKGEWTSLGEEGVDNDGDGSINEDGPGGDDMNRNWPSDWQPNYVQFGAGEFPFSNPEPRAIGDFIMSRPNIMAGQSYHNSGGMVLRGPGAAYRESMYPADDRVVYDELGKKGEDILPYYRYMIIYRDLYTVHGGFVNWLSEQLGAYAFTNEMWTPSMMFQRDIASPDDARTRLWRDQLKFGQDFSPYKEFDHPQYGTVLLGGPNKWSSRNTPTFMLEEECHRNFAFTMLQASELPRVEFGRIDIAKGAAPGSWVVTAELRNSGLIPTRSGIARQRGIGTHDLLICEPPEGGAVVASGRLNSWVDKRIDTVRHEPGRVQLPGGIGGRDGVIWRFFITGREGETVRLHFRAEKARDVETEVQLRAP